MILTRRKGACLSAASLMWTDLESNLASAERGQQLIARAMTRRLMDIVWDRMKLLFHEVVLHGICTQKNMLLQLVDCFHFW